jgi:hypothetical protein
MSIQRLKNMTDCIKDFQTSLTIITALSRPPRRPLRGHPLPSHRLQFIRGRGSRCSRNRRRQSSFFSPDAWGLVGGGVCWNFAVFISCSVRPCTFSRLSMSLIYTLVPELEKYVVHRKLSLQVDPLRNQQKCVLKNLDAQKTVDSVRDIDSPGKITAHPSCEGQYRLRPHHRRRQPA